MARKQKAPLTSLRNKPRVSRKQSGLAHLAKGGRVNFETGGLKYPDYGSTTTAPLKVTAERPSQPEIDAYFATHDADGNLIIPNEFAPPNIPRDTIKAAPPHAYNLPNEYSIPRLGAAGVEALTTLGTGLASYIGGGAYGIGKNITSGKYGTPEGARIGEEAAAKVVQDYTYQPRTQAGQDTLEGMGSVMETFKVPPLGFPELSMLPGMRRMTPTDVQVMHGRTKAAAQGAKQYIGDPVTDYYNAQQGITRDYPTLGAAAQRKAKPIVDVTTKVSENLSAPTTLNKQTGAIFPAGAPPRQVPLPTDRAGRIPESESGDPWRRHEGVFSGPQRYVLSRYFDIEARRQGLNFNVVDTAWDEFRKTKAQELYPTVQNSNIALRAYEKGYSEDERRAIELPWLDEFSKTNTIGMPDLDVVRESEAKAAKAYEQTYPKIIASKIGQENADFAVDAAKRGLVAVKDPQTIIDEWDIVRDSDKSRLRAIRRAAGKPEEGLMQQELDVLDTQIQDVSMQLEPINNARLDMEQQWSNRNEPPPEGYIELRAKEQKLAADKKGLMKKAALMRAAPAVEGLHDLSMMGTATPEELRNRIDEDRIQFHPYLADKLDPTTGRPITEEVPRKATEDDIDAEIEGFSDDAEMIKSIAKRLGVKGRARVAMLADPINNSALREDTRNFLDGHEDWGGVPMLSDTVPVLMTPKDTKIYIPEFSHLHSTGVPQTAREWADDIAARNTNKSYEQYFLAKAEGYKKVRDDKEKVEEQRAKLTNDLLKGYVAAAPADKAFGNYVAVEFNNSMSEAELGLGLSPDTKYLNHCVAQAGRDGGKYIPIYDLATRQHNDGITGPVSSEMREIINSGAIVTSIRDKATGIPVATIKFTKAKDGKYDLNYVNGLENGKIDPKAATAIRDFLNSSSTKLRNPGQRVIDNAGVYDLKAADHRQEAARNAGMKEQDINDYLALHPETTRYVTKDDVRAMKPQSVAVATRPAAPSEPIFDRIAGIREPAPTDFFDAHEIATTDTSTIPQLNAVLDDIHANAATQGHWTENMDGEELYDLHSSARSNLESQVERMVRIALRNPNATAERLTFLRNELENPTPTGPLRHVLPGNFDDVVQEIDNEIAHLNARANQPQQAIAAPVADADITHYINNMEDIDIAQHLTDWAREQGIAAPDDWATDHFNDMTPDEYGTIPSLRETVRAQLENEQLANAPAPRTAGDIADIANLPDNFEEVGDATTPTSALVANQIAQGQRGGAGDLNHVIDQLSDPASAGPLLAQLTPDEVDEMLSAASYHLESYVADAVENSITNPNRTREGLLRLADNLEDPPAEGPLRNISSTGFIDDIARLRAEAANLPVVGDWEPEAPMALPAPAPTIDVLVDEYAALPASHTSQARSEAIRGQIINNVPAVNPMSPTISDLGAMELIGATTGIRPSELLANAVTRNSTHLGMGSWSIGRRTQLQNFINQYIENQANNVQALPPALAAPLTNAITDEDVMAAIHDIRPAPLRTMLVEHYMNNGMTTREARSTARSVLDEYHANGGITGMGAGVDIRAAMRERLENERPAPAQVAPTPAQMRTMIENATPETITDIGRQLGGNHEAYGLVEFGDLTDLWVNRNTQLRNAPAMADLVNELSSLTQLVRPDMDQYARTDTLTDEIIANARPHVIPFTGAETPDEIANRIARLNPDIPPTLLAYLIGRRTTAEDVFGIRGLPDPLIHEVRAHLDTMHPANVPATNDRPALAAAVRHMLEGIQTAPSIDALSRMSTYIDGNRAAYTVPQWDVMQTMLTTRAAELRAALPAPTTQQAARTPAQMRTLIETATSLDVLQQMADYIHNNRPAYTDEQFRTLERLMTTRATEIANAGGAGFAHGGVVHMEKGGLNIRPSGSYNDYKDQYVKANRSTTGIDIDLLDKYGIGATKQKLNVTLPEGKIKQSDISELRARYKTDSGDQYGISYSPLEKRVSLSNPNPKEQSEWRADFSPMYSGISYNRNFAQGGAVEHEHLLNDIIGAMNG